MARAGKEGTPVFLVGGKPEVLAQTEAKLRNQWNVNIVGSQDGYFKPEQRQALFERIHASGAQIVTVAMGSPKQEIFMRDCRLVHPDALYMGVGGTYDVFTGHVKRAPKIWQTLGSKPGGSLLRDQHPGLRHRRAFAKRVADPDSARCYRWARGFFRVLTAT